MTTKILAVDDEAEILELIRNYFELQQTEITTSSDPVEAMKKIAAGNFSLVISDLKFPGKYSGMDILKAAKKRNKATEVIIITGYGTIESAVDAMKLGAYDYVTKPFKIEELCIKSKRILEMQGLRNSLDLGDEELTLLSETASGNIGTLEWKLQELEGKLRNTGAQLKQVLKNMKAGDPAYKQLQELCEDLGKKEE
jgi:DNA-binding NtrC family response regulator